MPNTYQDETVETVAEPRVVPEEQATGVADEATVIELLRRAAQSAADRGVGLETFVNAAYSAFLDTNPDVRAQLADAQMMAEIEALRRAGRVGLA